MMDCINISIFWLSLACMIYGIISLLLIILIINDKIKDHLISGLYERLFILFILVGVIIGTYGFVIFMILYFPWTSIIGFIAYILNMLPCVNWVV